MATRALVFGAGGWLGGRFAGHLSSLGMAVRADAWTDVADGDMVAWAIDAAGPQLVVNAAGRTHSKDVPNIDGCVATPAARVETLRSNALGAGVVAAATAAAGCKLVHLASACVFDGYSLTFTEADPPCPVSWYAKTKAMGDELVVGCDPRALVLRLRMPVSGEPHPRNMVTKLAGARQVVDVVNSLTVVEDLLEFAVALATQDVSGIVHAVNPGAVEFRHLVRLYREAVDGAHACEWIPADRYPSVEPRSNCVVGTCRTLPAAMPPSAESLPRMMARYAERVGVRAHG